MAKKREQRRFFWAIIKQKELTTKPPMVCMVFTCKSAEPDVENLSLLEHKFRTTGVSLLNEVKSRFPDGVELDLPTARRLWLESVAPTLAASQEFPLPLDYEEALKNINAHPEIGLRLRTEMDDAIRARTIVNLSESNKKRLERETHVRQQELEESRTLASQLNSKMLYHGLQYNILAYIAKEMLQFGKEFIERMYDIDKARRYLYEISPRFCNESTALVVDLDARLLDLSPHLSWGLTEKGRRREIAALLMAAAERFDPKEVVRLSSIKFADRVLSGLSLILEFPQGVHVLADNSEVGMFLRRALELMTRTEETDLPLGLIRIWEESREIMAAVDAEIRRLNEAAPEDAELLLQVTRSATFLYDRNFLGSGVLGEKASKDFSKQATSTSLKKVYFRGLLSEFTYLSMERKSLRTDQHRVHIWSLNNTKLRDSIILLHLMREVTEECNGRGKSQEL